MTGLFSLAVGIALFTLALVLGRFVPHAFQPQAAPTKKVSIARQAVGIVGEVVLVELLGNVVFPGAILAAAATVGFLHRIL